MRWRKIKYFLELYWIRIILFTLAFMVLVGMVVTITNGIQAWKVQVDGKVEHVYHEAPSQAVVPAALTGPWPLVSDCGASA